MDYDAEILAHSRSHGSCVNLASVLLTYPRIIHAEVMTHRVFTRNTSSSRAIPVQTMLNRIDENPFVPHRFGKNQSGMQAHENLTGTDHSRARRVWLQAYMDSRSATDTLLDLQVHKQITNRILETWGWIQVVITSTEWDNFFRLRRHKDAQPEIRHIAEMTQKALLASTPKVLGNGEYHLPLFGMDGDDNVKIEDLEEVLLWNGQVIEVPRPVLVSVGRCARTSYLTHKGVRDPDEDVRLARDVLALDGHLSPWEHVATPMSMDEWSYRVRMRKEFNSFRSIMSGVAPQGPGTSEQLLFSGNLRGWHSFRKFLSGESGQTPQHHEGI